MNQLDKQYQELIRDIIINGNIKETRNGGTKSVFGRQIRHKMSDGFPLLTTKKMPFKTIITELLWFLRGDTNIKYLVDNNCYIWVGDAYKRYVTESAFLNKTNFYLDEKEFIEQIKIDGFFAKEWGELGPIYGAQWRGRLKGYGFDETTGAPLGYGIYPKLDQIQNSINLLKTDPDSRRNIVSAWNVGELDQMVLPPCHNFFQFYTRELSEYERGRFVVDNFLSEETAYAVMMGDTDWDRVELEFGKIPKREISLIWNQRSVDTGLGLPFNIASYGLLLEIIAKMVNMVPGELIGNLGDTHLYNNHLEPIQEQLSRESFKLPKLNISNNVIIDIKKYIDKEDMNLDIFISRLKSEDFTLEGYESHPTIKLPLSN